MPIVVHAELRKPTQQEFATIAYDVMHHLFAVHNEFGRFLREKIYKEELAFRRPNVRLEIPIDVSFDRFCKRYAIDVLAEQSAIFELKAVDRLGPKHRAQLLNYLLLAELPHGKLVNMRPDVVEHEFVNTTLRLADRRQFSVLDDGTCDSTPELRRVKDLFLAMVSDWGTGLELPLYTEAMTELLGGEQLIQEIEIVSGSRVAGTQEVRLASPDVALKIASIDESGRDRFAEHAQRFIQHTRLAAMLWINVSLHEVTFRTIRRQKN
jgi:GxxExxY protein